MGNLGRVHNNTTFNMERSSAEKWRLNRGHVAAFFVGVGATLCCVAGVSRSLGACKSPGLASEPIAGWKQTLWYIGPEQGIEPLGMPGERHSQVDTDWLVGSIFRCKRDGYFLGLA